MALPMMIQELPQVSVITGSEVIAVNQGDDTFHATIAQIFAAPIFTLTISQNSQSADYTTVLSDSGKHLLHPSTDNNPRVFTIDSNAHVAYTLGTALTFVNKINTLTIAITSDTLTFAGVGTTGSRTLPANSMATAIKIGTTEWMISGAGLS